ncbi:MAG TPA: HDOD domain-containing protein [Gammaproteobacteria bacterium]|nr:HDOD domain-containing protein [Gammaproteobacteria bacterium]
MEPYDKPMMLASLRQRIESTTQLPAMPEAAQALLRLNADPNGNINQLVEIIETDPSIAAQVMRYARSAFFGFRGEITSLQQAVTAVLGYGLTIDIALGLSLGKAFSIPSYGPMGLFPFWQHSIYSAALIERIIHILPRQHRPLPGLGFLGGLLHNFGVLLIAHLFKKEAAMLQQIILANQDKPVVDLERQVLGTDHMEIGAWLMRSWNLQSEIQVAVAEHHDELYNGVHASYARLALLSDRLLKRHDIGDAESTELPEAILNSLGISAEQAEEQLENIISGAQDLDQLAQQFAA